MRHLNCAKIGMAWWRQGGRDLVTTLTPRRIHDARIYCTARGIKRLPRRTRAYEHLLHTDCTETARAQQSRAAK